MSTPSDLKYRAFLSYSHADTKEAVRLHRSIEYFHIDKDLVGRETTMGPVPQSIRPVFRDRHDFETGSIFTNQTLTELDASAALVVLCSPSSAKSDAVNDEVRLFRWRHPNRPIIPVMLKGTADTKGKQFFPPALRFEIDADGQVSSRPQVVLAADMREIGDGYDLAVAKVVARIIGVAPDEVYRRAERRRRQIQRSWFSGLAAVAGLLALLGLWAEVNRRRAVVQRQIAEHNLAVAEKAANDMVFTVFEELRERQGIRSAALGKILGSARQAIERLVEKSEGNASLRHIKAGFFQKMVDLHITRGDTVAADAAANELLAESAALLKAAPANPIWQHDRAVALAAKAGVLAQRQHFAAALEQYQSAYAVLSRLAQQSPGNRDWQTSLAKAFGWLGDVLKAQGRIGEASRNYQAGLAAFSAPRVVSGRDKVEADKARSVILVSLGDIAVQRGRYDEAEALYGQSLAIRRAIAADDPTNLDHQRSVSVNIGRIGEIRAEQGFHAEALSALKEAQGILEVSAMADPENARWQHDLEVVHNQIGNVNLATHDILAARQSFESSKLLAERLLQRDPDNADWRNDVLIARSRLADVAMAEAKPDIALAAYRGVLDERRMAATGDETNPIARRGTYQAQVYVGDAYMAMKDFENALAAFRSALDMATTASLVDQTNVSIIADTAGICGKVGQAYVNLMKLDEARAMFVKGRELLAPLVKEAPDAVLWRQNLDGFDKAIAALDAYRK